MWWQIDPKAEALYGLSPYNSMANNPIVMSDPEGDLPAFVVPLALAMIKGASIGVASNGIMNAFNGNNFFAGAGQAALFGAIGGAASHGIGLAAQGLANGSNGFAVASFQAGAHGLTGGALSAAQGGNFWHGAAAGAFSSIAGSATQGWGDAGSLLAGTASGAFGSWLAGGDPVLGAAQGMITTGLNHLAHELGGPGDPPKVGDRRLTAGTWGFEEVYDGKEWVMDLHGEYHFPSGAITPTAGPHEYLLGTGLAQGGVKLAFSLRTFVANSAKLHPRLSKDIVRGTRVNAGKRAATFMRQETVLKGKLSIRDWRTISFRYTTSAGQKFSVGYNPWTRTIIHMSPGH